MRTITLALAALLAACGGGTEAPTPTQVAPPVVTAPPKSTAIVFIGDSITAGWYFPDYVVNVGVSGQTSPEMLARFQADVLDKNPRVVHILAGTNDVAVIETPNVDSIARMAELAAQSGACVIVGTIPPSTPERWITFSSLTPAEGGAREVRFNADIRNLTRAYGYFLADYYPAFWLPDGTLDRTLFWDTLHPSHAGDDVMWSIVAPLIQQCLQR